MISLIVGAAGGITTISVMWLLLALASIGIGLGFRSVFTRAPIERDSLLLAFWCGTAWIVLLLQLWHFFLPIDGRVLALVAVPGAVGLLRAHAHLSAWLRAERRTRDVVLLIAITLATAWIANRSMGPLTDYDAGMYQLPVIQWSRAFPVVPGLGNLHGRLAFNNSSLLYASMLDSGFWSQRSHHLVHGLFALAFVIQILVRLRQLPAAHGAQRIRCLFDIALAAPVFAMLLRPELLTGFNTDITVAFIMFVAISVLIERLGEPGPQSGMARGELVAASMLLVLATTIKLSVAPVAGALWLAVQFRLARDGRRERRMSVAVEWTVALMLLLAVPWMARSIIMTGYPLYPATVFGMPVDWRVPAEQGRAAAAWVGYSARIYHAPNFQVPFEEGLLFEGHWLRTWIPALWGNRDGRWFVTLPLLLFALALPGAVRTLRDHDRRRREDALIAGVLSAGVLMWFVVAPRPEFGIVMTWGLAAIMVALACARTAVARAPVAALLALALGPLADNAIDTAAEEGVSPPIAVAKALFFRPGRDVFFHPGETGRMRPWRTSSGLRLWVPERLNRCFRAPLPCTPHPAANLRLRAGSLGGGFRVLGGWQPNRWPNPRSDFLAGWRERHRETPAQAAARESESRSGG